MTGKRQGRTTLNNWTIKTLWMPRGKDCEKKCVNYNKVPKKGTTSRKGVQEKDGVIVNYHGPYVDSSGEKFYLPRKWTLCPTTSAFDDGKMQH